MGRNQSPQFAPFSHRARHQIRSNACKIEGTVRRSFHVKVVLDQTIIGSIIGSILITKEGSSNQG